jgi:cardiolipin synthase
MTHRTLREGAMLAIALLKFSRAGNFLLWKIFSKGGTTMHHSFVHHSRAGSLFLTLLTVLVLSFLFSSCDIGISLPGSSTSSTTCQSNCIIGTGAQGLQIFVEPNAGESPVTGAIESAKHSVWLEMYILSDRKVMYALEDAANRGVDVRVMLEPHPYGTRAPTETMDQLRAAGVKVEDSSPSFALTHEKGMIIDGTTAFIMTSNFSRSGLGGYSSSSNYNNREYDIVDSNPQDVQTIAAIFQADWNRSSVQINDPNLIVSPVNSRSDLTALINSARSTILIESEEMNDSSIEQALANAVTHGVKVDVILPAPSGSSGDSNSQGISTIKSGGVQVREDGSLYMHAKLIVIDEQKAFVGSENFSAESLDSNRELGIYIADQGVLQTVMQTFEQDWNASQSV